MVQGQHNHPDCEGGALPQTLLQRQVWWEEQAAVALSIYFPLPTLILGFPYPSICLVWGPTRQAPQLACARWTIHPNTFAVPCRMPSPFVGVFVSAMLGAACKLCPPTSCTHLHPHRVPSLAFACQDRRMEGRGEGNGTASRPKALPRPLGLCGGGSPLALVHQRKDIPPPP